jgi:hypothetical protein
MLMEGERSALATSASLPHEPMPPVTHLERSPLAGSVSPPSPGRRPGALAWAFALAPFTLLALWRMTPGLALEMDDAGQYLMHARALVEGRSYRDIGYIYTPMSAFAGPASAPPGLPVTLVPVLALSGGALLPVRLLMLAFAVAFLLLAGRYFGREDTRLGIGVALLAGLTLPMVDGSTQVLTDLPFAALVWGVIATYDREGPWTLGRVGTATLLGAAAMAYRSVGAVLIPAILLFTVLHRRAHGFRPALPAVLWMAGGLLAAAALEAQSLMLLDPGQLFRPERWIRWGTANLQVYLPAAAASFLGPFPWRPVNHAYLLVMGLVATAGLLRWLPSARTRFALLFLGLYATALLLLPFGQPRYLWPLLPVLVFGMLSGVRLLTAVVGGARWAGRGSEVALVFAVVLATAAVAVAATHPRPPAVREVPEVREVIAFLEAAAAREPLRVTFYKPRLLAWETGIPTMPPILASDGPERTLRELRERCITHVVLGTPHGAGLAPGPTRVATEARPDLFVLEFRNRGFEVRRFREVDPAACGPGANGARR